MSDALSVTGDLTVHTAAAQKDVLLAALTRAGEVLALDLAGVGALDTAGLQLLLMLRRDAAAQGQGLHLSAHGAAVLETLLVAGLDPQLDPIVFVPPAPLPGPATGPAGTTGVTGTTGGSGATGTTRSPW